MVDFEVHVVSTASMNIFAGITLASFEINFRKMYLQKVTRALHSLKLFSFEMNNNYADFFYHVYENNGKEKPYEDDDDDEQNNEEEEDVDRSSVEKRGNWITVLLKKQKTKQVLMYHQKIKPEQYGKISNVLLALYSKLSWTMLQDGASRILEDGGVELQFTANAGFYLSQQKHPQYSWFSRKRDNCWDPYWK